MKKEATYLVSYTDADLADHKDLRFEANASFEDCEFQGIDFSRLSLKSVSFLNCKFTGCNFANQNLTNASFREINFVSCNAIGINWCVLRKVDWLCFRDSKINLSSFQDLKLKNLALLNCAAVDVDFSGADLTDADFSNTNLAGTNFNGSVLNGADFRSSRDYLLDVRKAKIKGLNSACPTPWHCSPSWGPKLIFNFATMW